jgi:hypothetical protein
MRVEKGKSYGAATLTETARVVGITRGGVWMAERSVIRKLWRQHRRLTQLMAKTKEQTSYADQISTPRYRDRC